MPFSPKTFLFFLSYLTLSFSYDTDLWAIVISTSENYENYRHSVNSLLIYNTLKKNGIPDEHIILSLAEYHACEARNYYPGKVYLSDIGKILEQCQNNIDLDYKETDVHNFQLLDILKGRKMSQFGGYRQLNSNKNSRILIIITSHGGEQFIKVRGRFVILSEELNRALNEMYIKERYKEIVFVLDTCEGYSLYDDVHVPNVYFLASALLNQKASSYSFDGDMMGPTADKFHYLLWKELKEINNKNTYDITIDSLFDKIKEKKDFLSTDVTISNNINRTLLVGEFFGNPNYPDNNIVTFRNIKVNNSEEGFDVFGNNEVLREERDKINMKVSDIKKFTQNEYKFDNRFSSIKNKTFAYSFIIAMFVVFAFGTSIII